MAMSSLKAIRTYFEEGQHGRKVGMDEIKALSPEERAELGQLACVEIGEEWQPPAK
jgi:hypothetical protein